MITIHKLKFNTYNQNVVWNAYHKLKEKRKGESMVTILTEIYNNQEKYLDESIQKRLEKPNKRGEGIARVSNLKTLIKALIQSKEGALKDSLKEEVIRLVKEL